MTSTNSPSDTSPTPDNAGSSNANDNNSNGNDNGNDNGSSDNRNGRRNNRNRNRRPFRNTTVSADNLRNFKGAIEALPVLGTKVERASQDFSKFTKALHNHVLTNFTYPKDISFAITEFKDPIRIVAADLPTKAKLMSENFITFGDETVGTDEEKKAVVEHNEDLKETISDMRKAAFSEFNKRKTAASSNMAALWGVIMGQCSGSLQQHVKAEDEYKAHMYDAVWLLQTLKKVTSGVTHQSNVYHSTFHALKDLYMMRQKSDETVEEYYRRFETAVDLVHLSHDTKIFDNSGLFALENTKDPNITKTDIDQRFLAIAFIENVCTVRYTALWKELGNSVAMKTDKYPKTLSEATYLLTHWKAPVQAPTRTPLTTGEAHRNRTQLSFLQRPGDPLVCQEITDNKNADGTVRGSDGETHPHITCHNCRWKGHYATRCPAQRQSEFHFGFTQSHFIFNQTYHIGGMSNSTMILDTGSTFNSFFNRRLLGNIQTCDGIRAYSNGGHLDYFEDGIVTTLPALSAYYNPDSLANILSLSEVARYYRVVMDTEQSNCITVLLSGSHCITFLKIGRGLYAYDTANKPKSISETPHVCMFSTVAANKESYSLAEVQGAENARTLQARIGWPSDAQFKDALTAPGTLYNCAITHDDVVRAHDITGGIAHQLLKGKSVRRKKRLFHNVPRINIDAPLLAKNRFDELDVDFMYVQGKPYLITLTRKILFQTLQSFNRISKIGKNKKITYRRGRKDIIEGINKVLKLYTDRDVNIETLHADGEFRKIEGRVDTTVECCATDEHIDRIERRIRVVKERARCYWVSLPYKRAPKLMVDENLFEINGWLNAYPYKHGISNTYSPSAIIQGKGPIDVSTLRVTFGAYCEVYGGTDNTNKERKISCIALRPCNNKGGYYFLNLETGRKIHGHDWTELAIPDRIIDRVHELADEENAPALDEEGCPVFEIDVGVPLNAEEDYSSDEDDQDDNAALDVMNGPDEDDDAASDDDSDGATDTDADEESVDDVGDTDDDNEDEDESVDDHNDDDASITDQNNETDDENLRSDNVETERSEEESNRRPRREGKQPSRYEPTMQGKSYPTTENTFLQDESPQVVPTAHSDGQRRMYSIALNVMFNQMHASKGIKMFKEKAVAAILKEYKQLNDMSVLGRIDYDSLTEEQKQLALDAVNLIKEKRNGKVKGRTCANGSSQRAYVPREEASSPTISLEALMSLFIIFAYEKRKTAVFDVPGAYLHADMPEGKFALLKITGQFVDIVCEVNPEFKQGVRYENGRKVLYVRILKAIYGMIESALLWYELYVTILIDEGYELNPYDKCVANKMVNDNQCTIGWYVDDNIVGHKEESVINDLVQKIDSRFPGLVVQKGPKLDFLGMELVFRDDGKLDIGTVDFLKKMVKEFEEDTGVELNRSYATPAASWLFKIKEAKELCPKFTSFFRKYVMKTLWASKRSRPDLETTMGFLTTRVQVPTKDDWHKLTRLMSFIKNTADDVRTIGADDLHHLLTLIDSAHAVHEKDMRGHTGSVSTMGTGVLDTKSSKQKMNTRSSTETEFVGTSEALPKTIFRCFFMEAQGYKIKYNVLGKDNESEIKLLKNGRDSCTWNSKHIAIKYFWVTDRIKDGQIIVEHCPTDQMIGDYMSKPVQGSLFKTFRSVIMGWKHISEVFKGYIRPEERVENNKKSSISYADVTKGKSKSATWKSELAKKAVAKQDEQLLKEIQFGSH